MALLPKGRAAVSHMHQATPARLTKARRLVTCVVLPKRLYCERSGLLRSSKKWLLFYLLLFWILPEVTLLMKTHTLNKHLGKKPSASSYRLSVGAVLVYQQGYEDRAQKSPAGTLRRDGWSWQGTSVINPFRSTRITSFYNLWLGEKHIT